MNHDDTGTADPVEAIARALLYEGYVLWPYRRSALKNRQRWTFGGVYPRGFCEEARQGDVWRARCQFLAEGSPEARLAVEVRFLQVVRRQVLRGTGSAAEEVDELRLGDDLHVSWDEATERRAEAPVATLGELASGLERLVTFDAGRIDQPIPAADRGPGAGAPPLGLLRRSWQRVEAGLAVSAERLAERLFRVTAEVTNTSPWRGADRAEAQRRALASTHLVLRAEPRGGGAFVSPADPPAALAEAASGCRSEGLWPVLVGEPGSLSTLLASPIILEDYPRVAPESPGDLFDGGEIDQLLTLNILALTDEEKREMAASDERTREILARTEALSTEQLASLHGTWREPLAQGSGPRGGEDEP